MSAKHKFESNHTPFKIAQDHIAWRGISGPLEHQSQCGLLIIVWRTRFSFVGKEFQQALHIKFQTLLGASRDQIPFHSWVFKGSPCGINSNSSLRTYT